MLMFYFLAGAISPLLVIVIRAGVAVLPGGIIERRSDLDKEKSSSVEAGRFFCVCVCSQTNHHWFAVP